MKWTESKLKELFNALEHGRSAEQCSQILGCTPKAVKCKLQKLGYKLREFPFYNKRETLSCVCCNEVFSAYKHEQKKYCSQRCAAIVNNTLYPKRKPREIVICPHCGKELPARRKFCGPTCQAGYRRNIIFARIESGAKDIHSRQCRAYLMHNHGSKCQRCGWCEKHPVTGNVPIELEHKDGNSENNRLSNLELLCPNCHSLTPTYRALNAGKGRHSRRERYKSGKSY